MALTKVSPSLFQVSNNITSTTVGGSANTISLTFDSNGVITGASNNALLISNTAITGNIISSQITSNPTLYGNVSVVGTASIGASDAIMTIGDNRRTVSTSTTTGAIVSGGGLGVWGDTYIGGNLSVAGGQIKFPASQSASSDANTLDDYEEGTWTPSIGGNATYSGQSGRYTKIGNFVCAVCDMTINVIGTGSTSTVSGLPFTAGGLNFGGALSYWNQTSRGLYFLAPQITGSTFWFIDTTSAMTTPNNSAGIFQNGTRIIVTVTYTVY